MPNRPYKHHKPTWSGFPPDLVAKWLEFTATIHANRLAEHIVRLGARITSAEFQIRNKGSLLKSTKEQITRNQQEIASLRERLVRPEQTALQEAVEGLLTVPEVIGTRVDSAGRLLIMVRVTHEEHDLGDYELLARETVASFTRIEAVRHVKQHPYLSPQVSARRWIYHIPSGEGGELVRKLELAQFVRWALAEIRNIPDYRLGTYPLQSDTAPEQVWDGYTANPTKALLHGWEDLQTVNHDRLASLEREQREAKVTRERLINQIRECQREVRDLRAERAVAKQAQEAGGSRSQEQLTNELRYITTRLKGVMGIRFTSDGTPIIHIRTSHVCDGQRYDMGDIQITLIPHTHTEGVVLATLTRRGKSPPLYWHHFSRDREGETGFFCFGNRAYQLNELLRQGEFGQLLHLLINGLNAVNDYMDSPEMLNDRFERIPMDAEWVPKALQRRRPRRRPRTGPLVEEALV